VSVIEPGARRRPGTATAGGYLMILAAILIVGAAVALLLTSGPVVNAARDAYTAPPPKPDQVAAGVRLVFIVIAAIYLLVAVGELILGLFTLRGSNAARIVTWVFNGLVVLCFGCLGALSLGGNRNPGTITSTPNQDGVDPAKFSKAVTDAVPSWSGPTMGALLITTELALIVSIVLLALPASNAFFRRRQEIIGAEPAYPGMPGYPPVPGYPPAGPPPAGPPAPPPPPPTDTP
jgi:hypothetical protein